MAPRILTDWMVFMDVDDYLDQEDCDCEGTCLCDDKPVK